ncbi:MAG: PQQ-binding-like beta-propeller repeat protein, partial [Verrucomicrobia bacterium]|nr:PQQ-binding-like beta-propeller repeat protein [Verrucomicrobiota bacterium]
MKTPQLSLSAVLFCACVLAMSAEAQEWTRFRGENGSGVGNAKGLPAKVTIANFNWIVELKGSGHSSPVLWGKDLYLTVFDKKDANKRHLVCYNANNGKVKWKWGAAFESHKQHRFNNFASSTPAVDGRHVYLFWGSGDRTIAVAVDHAGKKVWSVEFPSFTSDHGTATSPILVEGLLIIQTEHKEEERSAIIALDALTGDEVWRHKRQNKPGEEEKSAYSTSVVYQGKDGKKQVLAVNSTHGFISLDAKTGELLWQYNPGFKQRSVGSIGLSGDVVLATLGSGGGAKESVALRPGVGGGKVKKLYELGRKGLPYVPTPLAYKG